LRLTLGGVALLYPFILYFFRDNFPPLYLLYGLLALLFVRAIAPFILSPKTPKTSLQKNTLVLTSSVTSIILILSFFQGGSAALYYPVIMGLTMGSAFTLSLFFPPSLIERLARLQDPALPPTAVSYTKKVTKIWVGFSLLNAAVSYGTIIYGNIEVWTLYNGLISYILMGFLLGGEFLFRPFYKKNQHKKAFKTFTSLSHFHKKGIKEWDTYWYSQEPFCQNYPAYIATLTHHLNHSKAKRVFLISEDRAHFLAGLIATLQTGKVLVLPSTHKPDLLKSLLKKGDIILSDQKDLSTLDWPLIALNKITLLETPSNFRDINPKEAIVTFYTSGSSGTPKPINKCLSQLEDEVQELQKTWPLISNQNTTLLSTVPHHHLYGLLFSLLWPVSASVSIGRQTVSHWDEFKENESFSTKIQKNILISSPAHLKRFPEGFTHPFQQVFSSGGPLLHKNIQNSLQALGVLPTEVYGSTETGGIAYRQQTEENTPWTCFPTIRLGVDEDSNLKVASPYIETTDQKEGFFQTADRITLLNKAQFSLQGRSDRVIKIEGKRLSLIELESKLQNLNGVQEAFTLLITSEIRHEIGAIIVLTPQGSHDLKTLGKVAYVRQLRLELRSYFDLVTLPRRWRFVDQIPENAQGKRPLSLLSPLFEKEAA